MDRSVTSTSKRGRTEVTKHDMFT